LLRGGSHTNNGALCFGLVVVLCDRREHAFHQLASRCFVDQLRDRPKPYSKAHQKGSDLVMVCDVPRKSTKGVHNHKANLFTVFSTVEEKLLKLWPVGRLGGFALLNKYAINRKALLPAVRSTLALLGSQAQVMDLLFSRNATIDYGLEHFEPLN